MPGRAGYEASFLLREDLWFIFFGEVIEQTGGARGALSGRIGKMVSAVIAGVPGRVPDFMIVGSRSTASDLSSPVVCPSLSVECCLRATHTTDLVYFLADVGVLPQHPGHPTTPSDVGRLCSSVHSTDSQKRPVGSEWRAAWPRARMCGYTSR